MIQTKNNAKERAANYMRLKSGYNASYKYMPCKLNLLELYFISDVSISELAYKIGFNHAKLERIVNEWQNNDGYLTVESKINFDIKK